MKVKLKVYKHIGILRRDFSSVEQAQGIGRLMAKKYPDMRFEPHLELRDDAVIDLTGLDKDDVQRYNP